MQSGNLRPLYLGRCLGDLKKVFDVEPVQDAKKLCKSVPKLFEAAEDCRLNGDEEISYVYYMRYLSLVYYVRKVMQKDESVKNYFQEISSDNVKKAVEQAEKLALSLEKRYKLLEEKEVTENKLKDESKEEHKIEIITKRGEVGDGVNGFADISDELISCKRLNDLLNKKNKILIMDVRSEKSFQDSHMKIDCVINVPEEIVKPGLSASSLEKSLPISSRTLWKQRGTFSLIVLVDWSSSSKTSNKQDSPICILKNTLLKWDTDVLYKNNLVILDGGFEEWLLRYPPQTTNPHPHLLPNLQSLMTLDSLDDLEYPNLSESPEVSQPSIDRSSKPSLVYSLSPSSSKHAPSKTVKPSSTLVTPTHQKGSVSSKGSQSSLSRPNVDRQSKPAALSTYEERSKKVQKLLLQEEEVVIESLALEKNRVAIEEERERTRLQREMEAGEQMRLHLQEREEELLRNIKELERRQKEKDRENQVLREELNEYRRKEKEENIPREYSAYKQQEEFIKDRIRNAEEERRKIAEERKAREEHRSEVRKRSANEPVDNSQNRAKGLTYEERERQAREKLQQDRQLKDKLRQESEQARNDKLRNESIGSKDIRPCGHSIGDKDRKRIVEPQDETTNTSKPLPRNKLEHERGTYITPLKDTSSVMIKRSHSSPNISQLDDEELSDKGKFSTGKSHCFEGRHRSRDFSPVHGKMGRGLTGLKNLGNTCYMNSIIQCLSNTTALAKYFVSGAYSSDINKQTETRGEIAEEVAAVVRALWSNSYKSIATSDLRNVIGKHREQFQSNQQQDSNEFLTILMDWLHEDLKKPSVKRKDAGGELQESEKHWEEFYKENTSLIVLLFYGQQKSTVRCMRCNKESVRYETFSNLTLPLPSNTNTCTLEECVELYVKGERITGWKCPVCKEQRDAMKKFDIIRLPPVLIIHFKRFYIDGWCRKRQTFVKFPLKNWDMKKYTLNSDQKYTNYDLYGVSNHYGTMEGGHYTAYCKSTEHKKWYKFDDNEVSEISPSEVESGAAYILFYASINFDVPDIS